MKQIGYLRLPNNGHKALGTSLFYVASFSTITNLDMGGSGGGSGCSSRDDSGRGSGVAQGVA